MLKKFEVLYFLIKKKKDNNLFDQPRLQSLTC
jgi:hypothetical protein